MLTQTETGYLQIEKELLTVVMACYKFCDYIYGKPVVIETKHQPLVAIHNKPFYTVPARLQHERKLGSWSCIPEYISFV